MFCRRRGKLCKLYTIDLFKSDLYSILESSDRISTYKMKWFSRGLTVTYVTRSPYNLIRHKELLLLWS